MPVAPVRSGGEGSDDGAAGGPRRRYKPTQAEIDVSLAKGKQTQKAEMDKAAKAFAEDMEPWQWDEYEKGWSGPQWDKKKQDFIWSRIPGKHPDVQLARRGVSKIERQHKTAGGTRLQRSAAEVFAYGGIPGMGIFLGMAGFAGRSRAAAKLYQWGLTKNQGLYLPGGEKAQGFTKWLDAEKDLAGSQLEKAKDLLWKYEVDDIGALTREQSHLIALEVKTGKKIQAADRILKKRADLKKLADEQGKTAKLDANKLAEAQAATAEKAKLAAARKKAADEAASQQRAAEKYLDEPDKATRIDVSKKAELSQRGKEVTRQTKPYKGVGEARRSEEFAQAVEQRFSKEHVQEAAEGLASKPKVKTTDSFQGVDAPPPAPPRGKPRAESADATRSVQGPHTPKVADPRFQRYARDRDPEMTPQQLQEELQGMIGGTPSSGATSSTAAKPRMSAPDDVSVISTQTRERKSAQQLMDEAQRMQVAEGLGRARLEEVAKVAAQEARAEVAATKTVEDLLNQATKRSKRPKEGSPLEELEAWADQRTEVIANIRQKMQSFPDANPETVQSIEQALARLESTVVPAVRAEAAPLRKAADQARKVEEASRLEDARYFNSLSSAEKQALVRHPSIGGDVENLYAHIRKLRKPAQRQPRMTPDWQASATPTPASELGAPPKVASPAGAPMRQRVAKQLGPEGAFEKVGAAAGGVAKTALGGGLGLIGSGVKAGIRNPAKSMVGITAGGVGAAHWLNERYEGKKRADEEAQAGLKGEFEEQEVQRLAEKRAREGFTDRRSGEAQARVDATHWWKAPPDTWNAEFAKNPDARGLWLHHLVKSGAGADVENWGGYGPEEKAQVMADYAPSFTEKILAKPGVWDRFASKRPAAPPRAETVVTP